MGKGCIGDHPGGVINKGDEVCFSFPVAAIPGGRAVHDITHEQVSGILVGKPSVILCRFVFLAHQPVACQQFVHCGLRHADIIRHQA